jgi:hypothetical protein
VNAADRVASLFAVFPSATSTPERVAIYVATLSEYHDEACINAALDKVKRGSFLPSPEDIEHAIAEASLGYPPATPAEAWEIVDCQGDHWRDAHPVVKRALSACGGIAAIRAADNMNAARATFSKAYTQLHEAAIREECLRLKGKVGGVAELPPATCDEPTLAKITSYMKREGREYIWESVVEDLAKRYRLEMTDDILAVARKIWEELRDPTPEIDEGGDWAKLWKAEYEKSQERLGRALFAP